jgi:surface antigen
MAKRTGERRMRRAILAAAIGALPLTACASLTAGDGALYQELAASDVALASAVMQKALESAPDGASQSWTNRQTGNRGEITPLRTYVNESGLFCRDFREELAVAVDSGRFYHTACRDKVARWVWL